MRKVDVKMTLAARERQAAGRAVLDWWLNAADITTLEIQLRAKRLRGGHGPTRERPMRRKQVQDGFHPTRKSWTRAERRRKARAQRKARRANRA